MSSDLGSEALIESIYKDPNSFVKHEAALAVSNLGHGKIAIEHLLTHPDPDVVATAEISLERYKMRHQKIELHGRPGTILLDLTQHPEHRIQASFRLLEDNSETSIDFLLQGLEQETNSIVKHEIIFCLGEVASSRVVQPLINHMINDENVFIKHEAALALGTVGVKDAADQIRILLEHPNPDIVESAEIALERLLVPQ
jgi:deoxyhypusine monooxygenase